MASKTILELTEDTDPVGADVIETQKDGGGAGSSRFTTILNFFKKFFDGTIKSPVADGSGAVAFILDTVNDWTLGKLVSFRNNGVEGFCVNNPQDNGITLTGSAKYANLDFKANPNILYLESNVASFTINTKVQSEAFSATDTTPSANNMHSTLTRRGISIGARVLGFTIGSYSGTSIDEPRGPLAIVGQPAHNAATTNLVGGKVGVYGGDGAQNSTGDAHGGNVEISGGTPSGTGHYGYVVLSNLPTADPAVAGALWNDTGTLKISAG